MEGIVAAALLVVFFILSFFVGRLKNRKFMPFIFAALGAFFIVNAAINGKQMYGSILFAIIAISLTIKYAKAVRSAG